MFSYSTVILAKDQEMPEKWNKLYNMINEELKYIHSFKKMGPKIAYRMIELKTEKLKLIRQKENKSFLHNALTTKRKKSSYFRESNTLLKEIEDIGVKVIKKYPRYKYTSDIYYTLALNNKDYGSGKKTLLYLKKSIASTVPGSPLIYHLNVSMAEYYYNHKSYQKAIRYYRQVLRNKNDEWLAKHQYNASWCYLKVQDYRSAVKLLTSAYYTGAKENYITVGPQVLEAMTLFFVHAKSIDEGISFFINNRKEDSSTYLRQMAKRSATIGGFKESNRIINIAHQKSIEEKNDSSLLEILSTKLDFYRNFKRPNLYLKTSQELKSYHQDKPIPPQQLDIVISKIKEYAGYSQMRLTKNFKVQSDGPYDQSLYKRTITLFNILRSINPKDSSWYYFYQGETTFSLGLHTKAFIYYKKSLNRHKKGMYVEKGSILLEKIFDSMFSILEQTRWKKAIKEKRTIYAYQQHTHLLPSSKRSQKIYPKLYALYLSQEKITPAIKTLDWYKKHFSKDLKIQQGMLTTLIDYHIQKKHAKKLSQWIQKLKTGYLSLKPTYIKKATVVLGHMLFENYHKLPAQQAYEKYQVIYNDLEYPKVIRADAALKATIALLEISNADLAVQWYKKSFQTYPDAERFKKVDQFFSIANEFHFLQEFKTSSLLIQDLLKNYCHHKFESKNNAYIQSIRLQLFENNFKAVNTNYNMRKKCDLSKEVSKKAAKIIIQYYTQTRNYRNFLKFYKTNKNNTELLPLFSRSFRDIHWDSSFRNKKKLQSLFTKYLVSISKKVGPNSDLKHAQALNEFKNFIKENQTISFQHFSKKAPFSPESFQKVLEYNIEHLKLSASKFEPFIAKNKIDINLKSYYILAIHHHKLATLIKSYHPPGVPKDYVNDFKRQLTPLVSSLEKKSNQYQVFVDQLINKDKVFTLYNQQVTPIKTLFSQNNDRYPASKLTSTMDKLAEGAP